MKTTISIIIIVISLIFLANTTIQFKPFKISFGTPSLAIGVFLIIIGIVFIMAQSDANTYQKGLNKGAEIEHEAALEVARQIIAKSKTN
jgi:small neutral amino acid transporter SnatA (MarC family)